MHYAKQVTKPSYCKNKEFFKEHSPTRLLLTNKMRLTNNTNHTVPTLSLNNLSLANENCDVCNQCCAIVHNRQCQPPESGGQNTGRPFTSKSRGMSPVHPQIYAHSYATISRYNVMLISSKLKSETVIHLLLLFTNLQADKIGSC